MSIATNIRNQVTSLINTYGSTATITSRTQGSVDGGYTGPNYSSGSPSSITVIPSKYFNRLPVAIKQGMTDVGDLTLLVKYSDAVLINDKLTWQGNDYSILDIKPIYFVDVLIATRISLSKEVS